MKRTAEDLVIVYLKAEMTHKALLKPEVHTYHPEKSPEHRAVGWEGGDP